MRLQRLVVGAFGTLRPGLSLEFGPGLNVLAAPNEAGKSTLAELITGLLYGFGRRVGGVHPYEPWQGGGEPGGELVYRLDNGREFTLRRHLARRGERLSLTDQDGREVALGKAQPGQVHLGCGRGVFLTVARMDLDDLREAFGGAPGKERQESESQLLGFFYQEAATMGQTANPVEVIAAWRSGRSALYSRDRRSGKTDRDLVEQIEAARQELAQARQRQEQAAEVQTQLQAAEVEARELAGRRRQAEQQQRQAQKRLQQAADAARLAEIQAEIDKLTAAGLADEATHQQALQMAQDIQAAEQAARRAEEQSRQAAQRVEQLAGGRTLAEMEGALDQLNYRWAELQTRRADLQRRQGQERQEARELQERWQVPLETLAALDMDRVLRLRQVTDELAAARQKFNQAASRLPRRSDAFAATHDVIDAVAMIASGVLLVLWSAMTTVGWWPAVVGGGLGLWGVVILARRLMNDRGRSRALVARHQELGQEVARLQEERAALRRDVAGLPDAVDVPALSAARASASALLARRAERERDAAEVEARLAGLLADLRAWGYDGGGEIDAALSLARQRCREAAAAWRERDQGAALAEDQRRRLERSRAELDRLLASRGLADLDALAQARRRHRQVGELRAMAGEIASRLGQSDESAGLSLDQAEAELAAARAGLEQVGRAIRDLEGRRGELRTTLGHLLAGQGVAEAQARLERLEQRRRRLAQRHDTLLLAEELLNRAMDHYRLEAQPNLLQRAAGYLEQATRGSYTWLGSDLFNPQPKKKPGIKARRKRGEIDRDAARLSRGTRDQLYLCLRLALADEVSQGRERLPLILDDPLVNFDDQRLEGALSLLAEVARRRQVVLLTCHQGVAQRVLGLGSAVGLRLE